jgi:autotransporter passenger strand-loop-strand repeat protein
MTNVIVVSSGVTSDTIVSSGALMDVFDSGSTLSITVTNGGTESVYSGGVVNQTTVDYGGILSVGSGGTANLATVNSGGAQYVYAGGVASQTLLTEGATQHLSSGAIAVSTGILEHGFEYVSTGATAIDTLDRNGNINVGSGGTTVGAEIGPSGFELVGRHGLASATLVEGGALKLDGAKASGTILEGTYYIGGKINYIGATENIVNGASDTGAVVLPYGEQNVTGGTTTGTILSGGSEGVTGSGSVAYGTKIYSGGSFSYGDFGSAVGTIVENGGIYAVELYYDRATSGLLVSSGGTEFFTVDASSSTSATILAGGMEIMYGGTAIDTQLFGSSTVNSGAVTSGAKIGSGGYELITANATTSGSTVLAGGYELVQQSGNVDSATIAGGILEVDTQQIKGAITFTGTGGEYIVDTPPTPGTVISGFVAGDTIKLAAVTYSAGATVTVSATNTVTIMNGGDTYQLDIVGATVGETDFSFTSGSILTRGSTSQMQFLRPHVAPTDTGLNLTPGPEMFAARGATMKPAAAPAMATSATASIGAVPYVVTSAPHTLVVPPHGV